MFNDNFSKILTDQLDSSFRNVLQYFEILMLIAVLISLARFRESGNLNFLQSLSMSPFKILLLSSLGPILLSLLFMYAGQKSNLLNELPSKNDYFLVSDKAIFHNQPEEQKIFKLSEDNALEVIYSRANEENVFNIAIDGNFDDCQNIVKEMFSDLEFSRSINMSGVNSINWARIIAQTVYYFYSYFQIGKQKISFSVPTGNFGDVYAGYVAKQMGLTIGKFIVAVSYTHMTLPTKA